MFIAIVMCSQKTSGLFENVVSIIQKVVFVLISCALWTMSICSVGFAICIGSAVIRPHLDATTTSEDSVLAIIEKNIAIRIFASSILLLKDGSCYRIVVPLVFGSI